jgi:hypothetical protein
MGFWIRISNFVLLLSTDSSRGRLRNQVVSFLVWLWWVIDLTRFEFESGIVLFYFSFIFVSFGESCLLVSWCTGGRCGMACSDEDRGRSRRHGAEERGWSHRLGTRWLGGLHWHVKTRSTGFLVEPQNQGRWFVSGLASKPLGRFSLVWPQNQWRRFSPVWPQNWWWQFSAVWAEN